MSWLTKTASESNYRPDSTFSLRPIGILVNSPKSCCAKFFTLSQVHVFKGLFKKNAPLIGTPAIRRLKTYSSQSGYVYQYFYEGHRRYQASGEPGMEFVFSISPDRKNWHNTSVLVADAALRTWEHAHTRELSSTERYAIAKIALFQAFDERESPALMKDEVRVRNADIDGIIETLGL